MKIKQLHCSRLLIPCFCLQISSCHWFQSVVISLICTHKWVKEYSQLSVENITEQKWFSHILGKHQCYCSNKGRRMWGGVQESQACPAQMDSQKFSRPSLF